jgi:hypothetical protein
MNDPPVVELCREVVSQRNFHPGRNANRPPAVTFGHERGPTGSQIVVSCKSIRFRPYLGGILAAVGTRAEETGVRRRPGARASPPRQEARQRAKREIDEKRRDGSPLKDAPKRP